MSTDFSYTYLVDSRSIDLFQQCRPSALLGFLQEAATKASLTLNVSREEMIERHHAFWMLARIWYRLDRPLLGGEEVTIRTSYRFGKGASMYRDYTLYIDGQQVGEAVSTWVLADIVEHKLLRLSSFPEFAAAASVATEAERQQRPLPRVRLPKEMALAGPRKMRYSDTDMNRHVNNTRYADFACDAVHLEELGQGKFVSSFQVDFLAECRAGETLELYTAQNEAGDVWYAKGADEGGQNRFDASLTLSDLPEGLPDRPWDKLF